ncbi:MAG: MliC family protein [Azospirillaceae bacterium]
MGRLSGLAWRRLAAGLPAMLGTALLAVLVALGGAVERGHAAQVEAGPSFDCAAAVSDAERAVCASAALADLDRRLATRYADALDVAGGLDAGAEAALAELRATQRGWVKGRDDCWKAEDLEACVADAYSRRIGALVALYMLETPAAVTTWQCGESPANELVVHHFDLERPAVRLERGDSIEVGVQVPAASGARYEASFGVSLWTRGDEARLEWPEGTVATCRRR